MQAKKTYTTNNNFLKNTLPYNSVNMKNRSITNVCMATHIANCLKKRCIQPSTVYVFPPPSLSKMQKIVASYDTLQMEFRLFEGCFEGGNIDSSIGPVQFLFFMHYSDCKSTKIFYMCMVGYNLRRKLRERHKVLGVMPLFSLIRLSSV